MAHEASFTKALFFGVVPEDMIFPYPKLPLEEQHAVEALIDKVKRFVENEVDAVALDRERTLPSSVCARMRELGLFGLGAPSEYGGKGLSSVAACRVIAELGAYEAPLGLVALAHGAIASRALQSFGTEAQKRRFLPALASGDRLAALALTEAASGTDAGMTRTQALKTDDGWILNGHKPWVTGAERADVFIVFARTSRLDEGVKPRLTAFIVEKGPGVEIAATRGLLGLRSAGVSSVGFKDVRLPADAALGEVGKGFKVAMAVMTDARPALAAWLFGQTRMLVNLTVLRVQKRRSFGRAIGEFPILKNKISKMLADAYAVESMTYLTAALMDRGVEDYSLESAICRVAASEALWRSASEAMQVAGGAGYVSDLPLERRLRDARGGLVVDGTNETLRCFIALAGLRGPGERMQDVENAIYEPVKGFGLLRSFAVRKVREAIRRERVSRAHPLLAREAVLFEETTDQLYSAAQRALRDHGREIAEMQQTQVRIANVAIDLYALAACISRTTLAITERGESGARREIDLTSMFAAAARGRMHANLSRLDHNDDALRKVIAARSYTDGGYPFDVI